MLTRVCLCLVFLATTTVWSQIGSVPFETTARPSDEDRMLTPPPVDSDIYPTKVGSETRSNFIAAGLALDTAYHDNVFVGGNTTPVGDITYSILPTITLDQNTPRQQLTLTYSPGYTFYQRTSALNAPTQNAALNFQHRLTQHTTIRVRDLFQKSPDVFNQLYPLSGPGEFGSAQSPSVFALYANQLNNIGSAVVSHQFSRNDMIGVSGLITDISYSNTAEAAGFSNSNSRGGSLFYNRRLFSTQYAGVTYQYTRSHANPVDEQNNSAANQTKVQTHTILAFYTVYLSPTLSLSLSSGPQYSDAAYSPSPPVHSWTPSVMASIGWQRSRTNFVASYSRTITGSIGLSGAFQSNIVDTSARWRMAPRWTADLMASYFSYKNVTPLFSYVGHTMWGRISLQHSLSEQFKVELRYAWLQQSNSAIATIFAAPDSNSESISISYQLIRPLGR